MQFDVEHDGKKYTVKFLRVFFGQITVERINVWSEKPSPAWRKAWDIFSPRALNATLRLVVQDATNQIEAKLAFETKFPLMG